MTKFVNLALLGLVLVATTAAAQTVPLFSGSTYSGPSVITQSSGNVGIGTTAPIAPLTVNGGSTMGWNSTTANAYVGMAKGPLLELVGGGTSNLTPNIGLLQVNMGAGGMTQAAPELYLGATNGTSASSRVAVSTNELIGMVGFFGDDGTTVGTRGAFIQAVTDTSRVPVSTGVIPADLYLGTTSSAAIIFQTQAGSAYNEFSSTAEKMRIAYNGNVGIGTTNPGATLEVNGSGIKLTANSGASMTFQDGTVQATAWNGVLSGGDYAESVNVSGGRDEYEPGDVLVIDPASEGNFLKSSAPYSTAVTGIYSTRPGVVGRRQRTARAQMNEEVPMAMTGIVPTKVSAENGPIKPGDLLVTSSRPGYAMRGTDRNRMLGAVVGKAMGTLNSGTGTIEALVSLQ